MLFSRLMPLASVFVATASAGSSHDGSKKHFHGFKKVPILCEGLKTEDNGCTRYTQGFDVTGVVTTLELLFPEVKNVCDCIQECLNRPGTCANYIWDFHDADAIKNGNRTCVLYSNFNLPSNVTVVFAPNDTQNVNIQELENNPQVGSLVPQAFTDLNGTVPDDQAFSGYVMKMFALVDACRPVWQLANGHVQC